MLLEKGEKMKHAIGTFAITYAIALAIIVSKTDALKTNAEILGTLLGTAIFPCCFAVAVWGFGL